jgi:hypothetical protein
MHITIAERLRPFSHVPGFSILLPGSSLRFQIFPALIRVHDLSYKEPLLITEITIGIKGPVRDFTVLQDLEKGNILVWGHTADGYMRYKIITAQNPNFHVVVEKEPDSQSRPLVWSATQGFHVSPCQTDGETKKAFFVSAQQDESLSNIYKPQVSERLSLGNHKAQDWDVIRKHAHMEEIFPLWHRLGNMLSIPKYVSCGGTSVLLEDCRKVIAQRDTESILPAFINLFRAGFEGGLSPRLHDDQHQGFGLPLVEGCGVDNSSGDDINKEGITPLQLLTEGAALIRSLFVRCEDERICILPALAPELHCGRLLNVKCQQREIRGVLDIEWSKKLIRRMVFTAEGEGDVRFCFQNEIKRFRVRQKESERGKIVECSGSDGTVITVHSGKQYLFDRFEK